MNVFTGPNTRIVMECQAQDGSGCSLDTASNENCVDAQAAPFGRRVWQLLL
jgi:hypothetical protein